MPRPRLLVGAIVVALVAGGIVLAVRVLGGDTCGASSAEAISPLQSTSKMAARPNEQRDALSAAVAAMGPPFGPVTAGVDYYYDQWLHLYGVSGGLLAWTKNNAPVTYLDDATLKPRWSLKPTSKRTAWDTSSEAFLLLDLDARKPGTISSYGLRSGEQQWCVSLSAKQSDGQPVATTFLDGGDVVTALPASRGIELTRLSGKDGAERWSGTYADAGRADYLGMLTDHLLLVGGTEEYRLAQPAPGVADAPDVLSAVDARTGEVAWTYAPEDGANLHVIGVRDETVLAMVRGVGGPALTALDATGTVLWSQSTRDAGYSATLRGDLVVVSTTAALDAYDATTGQLRWSHPLPAGRTYFPYGFTLAQMPTVDPDHVLLATTTSLDLLDLRDGRTTSSALPTDGVSTTYWPYQLVATPKHLGVVANTGAILAARE